MPIKFAILGFVLALGACSGEQLGQGVAGFVVGATIGSVSATIEDEPVIPTVVDRGFEGAVEAVYPEEEETDLEVILTERAW